MAPGDRDTVITDRRRLERQRAVGVLDHHGLAVINRGLKATPEHLFMISRGDEWGLAPAEFDQIGDFLIDEWSICGASFPRLSAVAFRHQEAHLILDVISHILHTWHNQSRTCPPPFEPSAPF